MRMPNLFYFSQVIIESSSEHNSLNDFKIYNFTVGINFFTSSFVRI